MPSLSTQFILLAIGSRGDVDPLLDVGRDLASRGYEVLFVTFEQFARAAESAGLTCAVAPNTLLFPLQPAPPKGLSLSRWSRSLGDWQRTRTIFNDRTAWLFNFIQERHVPKKTVVVARTGLAGARIARELLDVRLVSVHHSPASFRSRLDSFRFPFPRGDALALRVVHDLTWRSADWHIGRILLGDLNRFRGDLGLSPIRRLFDCWAPSPYLNLGLFPDWYAAPQRDWPQNARLAGFPLKTGAPSPRLAPEVDRFLSAGSPPVIFTRGAHADAGGRFAHAVERITTRRAVRGLYLGAVGEPSLSADDNLLRWEFAPLGQVLPRVQAMVHHGGIGTMAMALAAGKPQVIVPVVGDQWDQGRRASAQGWGQILPPRALEAHLEPLLTKVIADPDIGRACAAAATRIAEHDGIAAAATILENVPRAGEVDSRAAS